MSILGKYTENIKEDKVLNENSKSMYEMPAVTRDKDYGSISLKKGLTISAILHPSTLLTLWLITLILALFGVDFLKFSKPKPKNNDIEFVLVDKEDTPKDKNTRYRADRNSRTGGINNPKLPVSMPAANQAPSSKPAAASSPSPAPKKKSIINSIMPTSPKKADNKKAQQTTTQKNVPSNQPVSKAIPKPEIAKPQPPTAKPSIKPPMTPRPALKPTGSPFKVPVPAGGTSTGQYATGPISGSGSSNGGGTKGGGTYSPNPSFAPVGSGSGAGKKLASGSGSGTSGSGTGSGGSGSGSGGGNPGGGGGRPGIDAIREPDFGPYMRELQRRIKMSWDPPKGNESKRVVLLFKIAKDGRLLSCRVLKSSGAPNADKAALNAVHLAAPFRPLPAEYKNSSVDIQFTFDYNVFSATKY
ncbi:TonB family protein [bacterium]|nr:TonB family protein [bacterium]